jgi:hypothetical protein
MKKDTHEWRNLIGKLRRYAPISSPVVVTRRPCKKNYGVTIFDGEKFSIRIDSKQSSEVQIQTLIHEWAHAVAIDSGWNHGPAWADVYGTLYNTWSEDKWSNAVHQPKR